MHVQLSASRKISGDLGKTGEGDSGPLVWVPFVEAIVPIVDLEKREMLITPPKGLLELNIRSDTRSKKERRELVRHTPFLLFPVLVPKLRRCSFGFYSVLYILNALIICPSGMERKEKIPKTVDSSQKETM